jgi:hypothetical protein
LLSPFSERVSSLTPSLSNDLQTTFMQFSRVAPLLSCPYAQSLADDVVTKVSSATFLFASVGAEYHTSVILKLEAKSGGVLYAFRRVPHFDLQLGLQVSSDLAASAILRMVC